MPEAVQPGGLSLTAKVFLLLAMLITISLFIVGDSIAPEIKQIGMMGFIKKYQFQGGLIIFSFTFGFPLGLHFIALAGLLNKSTQKKYILWTTIFFAIGSTLVVIWPFIVGNQNSRYYFMFGGIILLILIFAVTWFWAEQREQHNAAYRHIIDLRGMGYFFFAMATWNSCGMAGMPGYALYPERSLEVNAYPFIIGQTKVIMLYFILGWLFILLSALARKKLKNRPKV